MQLCYTGLALTRASHGGGGVGGGAGRSVGLLRIGGHHFGPRNLAVIRSREVAAK